MSRFRGITRNGGFWMLPLCFQMFAGNTGSFQSVCGEVNRHLPLPQPRPTLCGLTRVRGDGPSGQVRLSIHPKCSPQGHQDMEVT